MLIRRSSRVLVINNSCRILCISWSEMRLRRGVEKIGLVVSSSGGNRVHWMGSVHKVWAFCFVQAGMVRTFPRVCWVFGECGGDWW